MTIPSLAEFSQDPDKYYAAIGRRFAEIVAGRNESKLRDPEFIDQCLDSMESGDFSLFESLAPQEKVVLRNLFNTSKL